MVQNKGLVFAEIPTGVPVPGKHLVVESREFDLNGKPWQGGLTTKNIYASFDPYQRGRMRDPKVVSYREAYLVGNVIENYGIARVLKSDCDKFKPGDLICTMIGVEEYSFIRSQVADSSSTYKIANPHNLNIRLFLSALGMTGLTAYSSLFEIGKPKKDETIFISAASGAVGQIVGQLAKHEGLKVIGSVGDDKKLDFILNEINYDGGFNYKKEKPSDALTRLAPDGIDIYYENVGGQHLEAALNSLREHGRVVVCGMVSQYNLPASDLFPIKNLMTVIAKRLTLRGFLVFDPEFGAAYFEEHQRNMGAWISDGKIKTLESETEGIDNAPQGFVDMLEGRNFGKALLKIASLDSPLE
ncbi:MAG: hypothetical protein M1814_006904 [Vezdaea aestivalis]|nr:MAG: hypothetical protein M1814_006904 [Vezdaea aestivalis]